MFLSYDTIGYLKGPDIALVKDVETGTVAVRKKLRAELLGVYERLKSVEQANLPRVYETEEYEGECFAYYEYIEGETLEDIVHEGKYTIAKAEEWMEQLCAAMGALHAMQPCVVHRDIKPENIIISNEGVLKLIDLGAARVFKDGKPCDTEQIGTRGYAAPEQYGFNQSDARTDIYAAGTVLHVLMARFGEAAKAYNAVAARCTQLEPQNRYQSANAMKTALRMAKYKKPIQIGAWALGIAAAAGCVALACTLFASADANANADVPASAEPIPTLEANAEASPEATIDVADLTVVPYPTVTPKVVAKAVSDEELLAHFDPDVTTAENVTASNKEKFIEICRLAAENPHSGYVIDFTADIAMDEDVYIWPNMQVIMSRGANLTMQSGTSLNNYGWLNVRIGTTLRIDDGATLNLGRPAVSGDGRMYNSKLYLSGTLSIGKNTKLRFERGEEFGNGPVLEIIHDGVKRRGKVEFDDLEAVEFDDINVRYIFLTIYNNVLSENIADYIENNIFPIEQLDKVRVGQIINVYFRDIDQMDRARYVCDYFDSHPSREGIVDLLNLTIGEGDTVKFGSLEMGANTTLCLVQDSTLTVKNGGKLWINGMGVYPSDNTSIVVEEGAEFFMNDSYQSDTVNIIYK